MFIPAHIFFLNITFFSQFTYVRDIQRPNTTVLWFDLQSCIFRKKFLYPVSDV